MTSCLNSNLPNLNFCLSAYCVQECLVEFWPALDTYNTHLARYGVWWEIQVLCTLPVLSYFAACVRPHWAF